MNEECKQCIRKTTSKCEGKFDNKHCLAYESSTEYGLKILEKLKKEIKENRK